MWLFRAGVEGQAQEPRTSFPQLPLYGACQADDRRARSSRNSPHEDKYRDTGLDETESRMTTLGGAWALGDVRAVELPSVVTTPFRPSSPLLCGRIHLDPLC